MPVPDIPDAFARDMAVVRAVYDAFAAKDLDAALACMTDDVRLELETTGRLSGRHEPYIGHDGVREFVADYARIWDDLTVTPQAFHPAHGHVVVHGLTRGRIGAQEVHSDMTWTWMLRDGLVSGIRASGLGEVGPSS